jgi:hypothetical protein
METNPAARSPDRARQDSSVPRTWPSGCRSAKPPFDRERFVFKTLAVVIGTQLLIYSLAAGVCGQRALEGRPIGEICPGTLEQLQGGFDSTLNLLLALLGGAALTRMDR